MARMVKWVRLGREAEGMKQALFDGNEHRLDAVEAAPPSDLKPTH